MKSSKRVLLLLSLTITLGPVHEKLKVSALTPQLDYYYGPVHEKLKESALTPQLYYNYRACT